MSRHCRLALHRAAASVVATLRRPLTAIPLPTPNARSPRVELLESRVLMARVEGIDVSQFQGTIDWNQVRDAGKEFAFVRATIGGSGNSPNLDTKFLSNMSGGAAAGMLLGVYHRAKPDAAANDAVDEANWFLANAAQYMTAGWLRPVVDIEGSDVGGLNKAAVSAWVNTFSDTVEAALGVSPIVYANTDTATNLLDTSVSADHDLWIARYNTGTVDAQNDQPQTPSGYPNPYGAWNEPFGSTTPSHGAWNFWQYTNQGTLPGITENYVDLNVFHGDRATLESELVFAQPPATFQAAVKFGPYETATPSGYVNFADQTFTNVLGYQMGWNAAGAKLFTPGGNPPDQRYRTYAMPNDYNGLSRSFEVAVPNGSYRVRVVAGSPTEYGNTHKFWAEGVSVVSGVNNSVNHFISGVQTVTVNDGRLTISSDSASAPYSRLVFVDVVDAGRAGAPPSAPSSVSATPASSTAVDVRWTDLADNEGRDPATFGSSTWGQVNEGYKVERRTFSGGSWSVWSTRGHARANAELYQDTGLSPGTQYQYRVSAVNGAGASRAVAAASVTTPPGDGQQSYSATGEPWPVGTTIEAEDYDRGGQGVSFNDLSPGSAGGFYRPDADVGRIGTPGSGAPLLPRSHRVGWFRPGEWVEYTVDVPAAGDYMMDLRLSSLGAGGKFHVASIQGGVETNLAASAPGGRWDVPNTGDWDTFQTVSHRVRLPAGVQVIRVYADQAATNNPGVMDFDWLRFTAGVDLSVDGVADADEETVGRHVPLNDDHDELNVDAAGRPLPDNEPDAASEDHRITETDADLVDATLHLGSGAGSWRLEFPGEIRVWRRTATGAYESVVSGQDVAIGSGEHAVTLKIEGVGASFEAGNADLRAVLTPVNGASIHDVVRLTVAGADLDIDSDDDDGYGMPAFSHEEDRVEGDAARPGKTIFTGDAQRVPISVLAQVPAGELADAKIRLSYSAADLSGAGGLLRLWRSATSQDPADYLAAGEYTGAQLGLGTTAQELILYAEGVAPTTDAASRLIRVEIDPDGAGAEGFVLEDGAYVTVQDGSNRPSAIEGYVWDDRNGDGVRNSTTTFVPGDPPDVVYVVDISGSTHNPYRGTPVGDVNGDGRYNTILDGEIAGFLKLNQYLRQDLGFGNTARVALVAFSSDGRVIDLDPRTTGSLDWTSPAADLDGNGTPDVEQIISSLKVGHEGIWGQTDYEAALQQTSQALEDIGALSADSTVVFLSDGYPNEPTQSPSHYEAEVTLLDAAGVNLRAFGAGTGASLYHLKRIDPNAEIFTTADPLAEQVFGNDTEEITVFTEPGTGGWTVFADLDADGAFDANEPHDVSDADGSYRITGLAAGTYTLRQVPQDDWLQTAPAGGTYAVTVAAGQVAGDKHFGNRFTPETDLDVDSDNTNGTGAPDRSTGEDANEDDTGRLGKVIQINNGDTDGDSIPGYADLQSTGTSFTPMVLDLSGLNLSTYSTVRFTYSGSAFYSADPGSGRLRLWTKDAAVQRSSFYDYVRPGTTYYASNLGITSGSPTVTLYVEGVAPTAKDVDRLIRVDVDPDGPYGVANPDLFDVVFVTAVNQPGLTDLTDTDADRLPDAWESDNSYDPATPNSVDEDDDADGLSTFGEFVFGTNPIVADTDGDALRDGWEADYLFDPLDPDQNDNGVTDGQEDLDEDGLDNAGESTHGTDPRDIDTDSDLLLDGWEVGESLDPLNGDENGNGVQDGRDDFDTDDLDNVEESVVETDPNNADTDGDGTNDGDETQQGSNPTDPSDGGQTPQLDPETEKVVRINTAYDASRDLGRFRLVPLGSSEPTQTWSTLAQQSAAEFHEFHVKIGQTYDLYYEPVRAYDPPDNSVSLSGGITVGPGVLINPAVTSYIGFHNTPRTWRIVVPGVNLVAHRTGGKLGEAVSDAVEDGGDPKQYLILTNNDFEEGLPEGKRDFENATAAIPGGSSGVQDDDLAKITLKKLQSGLTQGTVEVVLSNAAAVRLFKSDGSQLTQRTLNLSSPSGDLAGLLSGDLDVWLEGLSKDSNFSIAIVYKDAQNREIARDDVHMALVDWNFRDGNGNDVIYLPPMATETLGYIADNASAMTEGDINAPESLVQLRLDGLSAYPGGSLSVTSDVPSSGEISDVLEFSGDLATSKNKIGMYSSNADDSPLNGSQVQTLQQKFGIDVVHNPKATVKLLGQWDEQRRELEAPPSITWDLGNQVIKSGQAVQGTVSLDNPDPNLKYEFQVTGSPNPLVGPTANISLAPTTTGLNGFYLTVTVKDGQGKVIGVFEDDLGRSVWVLPANTTAATLQWSQQAFAALQDNGDAIPAYPQLDSSNFASENFFALNNRISRAYATMYNKDPGAYAWCGLAAYVSNRGGQGIALAGTGSELLKKMSILFDVNPAGATQMYEAFTKLNQTIFLDMYRQFVAYDNGGINAIQAMANEQVIQPGQRDAWGRIDAGRVARAAGNAALASQEFWGGNFDLADVEQNLIAQDVYDDYKPIFLFLSNDAWFKTQLKSPVPGDNSTFGDVVPNGVNGGQANVAVKEDRWQWVTAPNVGLWDKFKAWQPAHPNINLDDVTSGGMNVENPDFNALKRLAQWQPPA